MMIWIGYNWGRSMYFKLRSQFLGAMLLGVFISGCDFIRSSTASDQRQKPLVFEVSELKCLESFSSDAQKFINDQLTAPEIESTFECLDMGIQKFQLLTEPSEQGKYSSEELRYFLNRYMLNKNQISRAFMSEIMKIKSFALGGDADTLSSAELDKSREYLQRLKKQALLLNGFMQGVTLQSPFDSEQSSTQGHLKVKQAVQDMLREIAYNGDYSIQDFLRFLTHAVTFAGHLKLTESLENHFDLILAAKNLMVGIGNNTQNRSQWLDAVEWGIDVYGSVLEIYRLKKTQSLEAPGYWNSFINLGDKFFEVLKSSPQFQHHRRWHTVYLDQVIDELMDLQILNITLTKSVIKEAYKMAIVRFINRDKSSNRFPDEVTYISEPQLSYITFEWQVWKDAQLWLLGATDLSTSSLSRKAGFDIASLNTRILDAVDASEAFSLQRRLAFTDWLEIFSSKKHYDWDSYLSIHFKPGDSQNSLSGLALYNGLRSMIRLAMLGYADVNAEQPNPWLSEMSLSGLKRLEREFFSVASGLRIIDPRVPNRTQRFMQEANLFTKSGNGDEKMSAQELLDLSTLMLVGGRFVTHEFLDQLLTGRGKNLGCFVAGVDILDKAIFEKSCVLDRFVNYLPRVLDAMPGFHTEWQALDLNEKHKLADQLLYLGRVPGVDLHHSEFVEYRTAFVVMYYLESIFNIYDTNENQLLELDELEKAAPRFRQFIKELLYLRFKNLLPVSWAMYFSDIDSVSDAVFVYIAFNGKEPGIFDLLFFERAKRQDRAVRASGGRGPRSRNPTLPLLGRSDLIQVLSILKNSSAR